MKMKKFLAALLATGLVLSTVGCGSSDSGSEGSGSNQQASGSAGSESGTESSAASGTGNVTDGNYGGFDTFLYCSSKEELTTLQYEMMKLLSSAMQSGRDLSSIYGNGQQVANTITPTSIRAAVTIVASVPILVVYPFMQKYFVKGVTLGATKE